MDGRSRKIESGNQFLYKLLATILIIIIPSTIKSGWGFGSSHALLMFLSVV